LAQQLRLFGRHGFGETNQHGPTIGGVVEGTHHQLGTVGGSSFSCAELVDPLVHRAYNKPLSWLVGLTIPSVAKT
jgi:hypothetical protein